jgi:hypothetical protein
MKATYSLSAGARKKAQLEMSDQDYRGDDDGSWLGFWIVIVAIVAIVIACMYGYSQYTSVLP